VILPDDQSAMFTIQQLTSIAIAPFNRSIREFKLEYPAISFPVRKNNSSIKDVWKWSAGIQMAYQYTLRDLKGRDGISSAHLTERIDSENSLDAYRIDVNAQLNYKNTFLETGISFSQLTDRLYTSSVEEKTIFIDTITQVLIYKDSSMSSVQGMLEGVERIKTEHQRYNRYNTIDIPIIFGYEHNTGLDKWRYYLSGGVLLNIQFKKSGSMLSPDDGNLVSLSSLDAEDYWNNRLGMKFLIAGGLKYQFHPKFEFRFGPQFEFGGKSFSSRDSGISQNYTRLGIRTGIYLNF
jgi:hypothetical protein